MSQEYEAFLARKTQLDGDHGFEPVWMPEFLFDFQRALVEWSLRKGRAAIFADCGMGKTPMQLVWSENVHRKMNRSVLIVTPLAVSAQTIEEAAKFGLEVRRSDDGTIRPGLNVTNYERLHHFDPSDVAGVAFDESSAIKSFDGVRRQVVTEFARKLPCRLLSTATAAPNDYVELGTSSEALGYLGHMDMLNRFFKNDQNTSDTSRKWRTQGGGRDKWRFKGHAESNFWRWVCSWARALRKPSDLGFDDARFLLPKLKEREHLVKARTTAPGMLFELPAAGLFEERQEARRTIEERCQRVAELVEYDDTHLVWCNLNAEGDLLERLIPQSIQVDGSDSIEYREAAVEWFRGKLCVCSDPMFRGKLASWERARRSTGRATIGSTESDASPNRPPTTDGLGRRETPIADAGTGRTRTGSAPTQERIVPSATPLATASTQPIAPGEKPARPRRGSTGASMRTGDGARGDSSTTGSPDPSSLDSERRAAGDVRSAEGDGNSTSITVTDAGMSADYSAIGATSGSGTSRTTRNSSSGRRCICGHESGRRVLISKARIFGWGLNLQFCAHITYFPSHSFEAYYQAVRRCWRFGQKRTVVVDIVTTEGGHDIMGNLFRKAGQAERMFSALVAQMNNALAIPKSGDFSGEVKTPPWLSPTN